jgi:hypothetical protein
MDWRMTQSHITVLDPTARGPQTLQALTPPLDTLAGRILGIRVDRTWKSFARFAEVVRAAAVLQWRVREVLLFDPGSRVGTSDEEQRKIAGFVRAVDAAIVGLGT